MCQEIMLGARISLSLYIDRYRYVCVCVCLIADAGSSLNVLQF